MISCPVCAITVVLFTTVIYMSKETIQGKMENDI